MGRKGVSKRKPSQAKSKNQPGGPASIGNLSELPILEKKSAKSSETGKSASSDWKKNSKKE